MSLLSGGKCQEAWTLCMDRGISSSFFCMYLSTLYSHWNLTCREITLCCAAVQVSWIWEQWDSQILGQPGICWYDHEHVYSQTISPTQKSCEVTSLLSQPGVMWNGHTQVFIARPSHQYADHEIKSILSQPWARQYDHVHVFIARLSHQHLNLEKASFLNQQGVSWDNSQEHVYSQTVSSTSNHETASLLKQQSASWHSNKERVYSQTASPTFASWGNQPSEPGWCWGEWRACQWAVQHGTGGHSVSRCCQSAPPSSASPGPARSEPCNTT